MHHTTQHSKNILFVIDSYPPEIGGIATVFSQYVEEAQSEYDNVFVVTRNRKQKDALILRHQNNLHIISLNGNKAFFISQLWKQGRKICKKYKINLIHTTTIIAGPIGLLLAWRHQIPVLMTVHELFGSQWKQYYGLKGLFFHRRERLIFRLPCTQYHCVSHSTYNDLVSYYPHLKNKIQVIHNGIQNEESVISVKREQSAPTQFLYAGHTGKSKGTDVLISAIDHLIAKTQKPCVIHFNILTDKNTPRFLKSFKSLQKKIKTDAPHIHLKTSFDLTQSDFLHVLKKVDCCIIPSYSEGFSILAAQASHMGKKIICSHLPVFQEVTSGEVLFFNRGDAHALAENILHILDEKEIPFKEKNYLFSRTESRQQMIEKYRSL
jgi:glycosyltransferase involved in cell wall biosynthesis